ncbi:hypothetical protein R1flu_001010 [Riccia fluitans]|uniref:Uncharacterized protein n=1 Tax=Riccia fluitans TaxID=41844 RepID=A0ABD1Y227_9MARC
MEERTSDFIGLQNCRTFPPGAFYHHRSMPALLTERLNLERSSTSSFDNLSSRAPPPLKTGAPQRWHSTATFLYRFSTNCTSWFHGAFETSRGCRQSSE